MDHAAGTDESSAWNSAEITAFFLFLKSRLLTKDWFWHSVLKLTTDRNELSISGILSGTDETSERTPGFMSNMSNHSMITWQMLQVRPRNPCE